MHENFFEFDATHTVWLAANHKPTVRGNDDGIWRRLRLVPFTERIPDAEQDRTLPEKLKAEFPGILAWAVRGCLKWQESGLREPLIVQAATSAYRNQQDVLGTFLEERCVREPSACVNATALLREYHVYCEANGEYQMSGKEFAEALKRRGIEKRKSSIILYVGIQLRNPEWERVHDEE